VTVDINTLEGYFQRRYADSGLLNIIPNDGNDIIASRVRFSEAEKVGEGYFEDVRVQRSLGWTFAGGALAGTAYALNSARSGQTKPANISANSFVLREQIAYDAMERAQKSPQSFGRAFDDTIEDMNDSSALAREISLLYGGDDLGEIEVIAGSGTTRDWTLSKATSSAGVWWQFVGAAIDVYDDPGGTQINTDAVVIVTKVDLDSTGRVVVSVSGDADDLTNSLVGHSLVPLGADGNWMTGLMKVAKTSSSTLYGINVETYPLFKATSHDVGTAAATVATIMHAVKRNRLKSGGGKRTLLCSTATWTDLNNNTTVLQRFLGNQQKAGVEFGTKKIDIENAQVSLEIVEHPLLKEGEAAIVDFRKMKRIGSRDHGWESSVSDSPKRYFFVLPSNHGFEIRCSWDQGLYVRAPNCITRLYNIQNSV
jgi:hypothetical protein